MRDGSIDGPQYFGELICPTCFCVLAEQAGIASGWRLDARAVNLQLETVTPSGRIWDPETDLWKDPEPAAPAEKLTCQCDPIAEGLDHHPWCGRAEAECPHRGLHEMIPATLRCASCGFVSPGICQ
jgi:hypothetical protein